MYVFRSLHSNYLFVMILCLLPGLAGAQSPDTATPPPPPPTPVTAAAGAGAVPLPVAQVLVPEGVYALQLLTALQLPPSTDAAKAEAVLSSLGIEPKNGWISEYPVTPAVLGDVDMDISLACDQGKIAMSKAQALQAVAALEAELGFQLTAPGAQSPSAGTRPQTPAGAKIYMYTDRQGVKHLTDDFASIPEEYRESAKLLNTPAPQSSAAQPGTAPPGGSNVPVADPGAINSYYADEGPPAVTYYAPPEPYYYLYSWVPYPFWSGGFYFGGFFVLNNFYRQVIYRHQPYYVGHHVGPAQPDFPRRRESGEYYSNAALNSARAIAANQQNRNHHPGFGEQPSPPHAIQPGMPPHAVQPGFHAGNRQPNQAPALHPQQFEHHLPNQAPAFHAPQFENHFPNQAPAFHPPQFENHFPNQAPAFHPPQFENHFPNQAPAFQQHVAPNGFEEQRIVNSPHAFGGGEHMGGRAMEGGGFRGGRH